MYQTMQRGNHRAPLEGVGLNVSIGIINRTDSRSLDNFRG